MRGSALQASIASVVNHTVRLPRARRPALYTAQLVTRCRCLGMRCRRSRLALNGMAGAPLRSRARPHPSLPEVVHPGDPCNNVTLNDKIGVFVVRQLEVIIAGVLVVERDCKVLAAGLPGRYVFGVKSHGDGL